MKPLAGQAGLFQASNRTDGQTHRRRPRTVLMIEQPAEWKGTSESENRPAAASLPACINEILCGENARKNARPSEKTPT
ncbi:MAG: hypothetical protein ABFC77_09360 [Thermoguttaceae bacterium]